MGRRHRHDRVFLTSVDMAEAKHMESIANAKAKRGENGLHQGIYVCGCGNTGCLMLSDGDHNISTIPKDY